jgi:ATP-dependent Clp protease ATP-binding subunit ClpA
VFERFTDDAREVVVLAQTEARSLHHNYIGTEHLLLGLLSQQGCTAAHVLERLGISHEGIRNEVVATIGEGPLVEPDSAALEAIGVDLDEIRRRVEEAFGPGALERIRAARALSRRRRLGRRCGSGHIPFTPRAKKALELSVREALVLGHRHIGSEHILLGVTREEKGVAAQLLRKKAVDYRAARQRVLEELGGYADSG